MLYTKLLVNLGLYYSFSFAPKIRFLCRELKEDSFCYNLEGFKVIPCPDFADPERGGDFFYTFLPCKALTYL